MVRIFFEDAPKVLDDMDELSQQVGLCPELAGGDNLDYKHQQSVGPHDDQEHLERLLQGEEGVEGVGGRGGNISVAPPVQLSPPDALVQASQLDCVIGILVAVNGPEYCSSNDKTNYLTSIPYPEWNFLSSPMVEYIGESKEGHKEHHHGQHAAKSPEESPGPHDQLGGHREESFVDFDCLQVEVDTSLHAPNN